MWYFVTARIVKGSCLALMEIATITKLINTTGLCFDILGAWFVASEVVRQYKDEKFKTNPTWNDMFNPPKETNNYKKYERLKYVKMKFGLLFLTLGFFLQIAANWPCIIKALFSYNH